MVASDRNDRVLPLATSASRGNGSANGRTRSIAITSGKGGVGKTNIAVNLAICLAASGKRVMLVDLDTGLANADVLLDVQPRFNLAHVLSGECDVSQAAVRGPAGVHFLAGGSGIDRLANMDDRERRVLLARIRAVGSRCDVVIYDCGAGVSANVTDCALQADRVLVVSTPEPTALTDAYAMVKVLSRAKTHCRIGLLVNMVEGRSEAKQVYGRVAGVAARFLQFSLADAGYVLHDSHVQSAVRERRPFYIGHPRCPAGLCIAALAVRLFRSRPASHAAGGVLARLADLFA